jgi:hypothetical protein
MKWSIDDGTPITSPTLTIHWGSGTDTSTDIYTDNLGKGNHSLSFEATVGGIAVGTQTDKYFTVK